MCRYIGRPLRQCQPRILSFFIRSSRGRRASVFHASTPERSTDPDPAGPVGSAQSGTTNIGRTGDARDAPLCRSEISGRSQQATPTRAAGRGERSISGLRSPGRVWQFSCADGTRPTFCRSYCSHILAASSDLGIQPGFILCLAATTKMRGRKTGPAAQRNAGQIYPLTGGD